MEEATATRDIETAQIATPSSFAGDTLHGWINFVSATQQKASSSIYLGTVIAI